MSDDQDVPFEWLDPDTRFHITPSECKFPGCEETGRSLWRPYCSDEHHEAHLQASAEVFGRDDLMELGELRETLHEECEKKLEAIQNEPERTPTEMQAEIDRHTETATTGDDDDRTGLDEWDPGMNWIRLMLEERAEDENCSVRDLIYGPPRVEQTYGTSRVKQTHDRLKHAEKIREDLNEMIAFGPDDKHDDIFDALAYSMISGTTHDPIEDVEFSASVEFESETPPRDIRKLFRADGTVEIESNSPAVDGEYRRCDYCESALVNVDYYEEHLEEEHNIER